MCYDLPALQLSCYQIAFCIFFSMCATPNLDRTWCFPCALLADYGTMSLEPVARRPAQTPGSGFPSFLSWPGTDPRYFMWRRMMDVAESSSSIVHDGNISFKAYCQTENDHPKLYQRFPPIGHEEASSPSAAKRVEIGSTSSRLRCTAPILLQCCTLLAIVFYLSKVIDLFRWTHQLKS